MEALNGEKTVGILISWLHLIWIYIVLIRGGRIVKNSVHSVFIWLNMVIDS